MNCKAVEHCGVEPYNCMLISGSLAFSVSNVTLVLSNDTLLEIMRRRDCLSGLPRLQFASRPLFERVFQGLSPFDGIKSRIFIGCHSSSLCSGRFSSVRSCSGKLSLGQRPTFWSWLLGGFRWASRENATCMRQEPWCPRVAQL